MNDQPKTPPLTEVDSTRGRRLIYRASTAARSGDYSLASELIAQARAIGGKIDLDGLDLQARIYAQQGMLLRAEVCWTEALQKDPGNGAYLEGLSKIRRVQSPLSRITVIALASLLGTVLVAAWWGARTDAMTLRRQETEFARRLERVESGIRELRATELSAQTSNTSALQSVSRSLENATSAARSANVATSRKLQEESKATKAELDKLLGETQKIRELLTARPEGEAATARRNVEQSGK